MPTLTARRTRRMTLAQFAAKYMDVPHCELVRGKVERLMPGGGEHSAATINITRLLGNWTVETRRGRVLGNEAGLVTRRAPGTVRGVDVAYCSYARVPKGKRPSGFWTVPPELVVEVIGKGQGWPRLWEKALEYFLIGVERVWIVDPGARCVHVLRRDGEPRKYTQNETLRDPEILPGFSCKVAEFFED